MKNLNLKEEIYKKYWPVVVNFIENGNDTSKILSNMDLYHENLSGLEAIEAQVQSLIRDLKNCKKFILDETLAKKEQVEKDLEK